MEISEEQLLELARLMARAADLERPANRVLVLVHPARQQRQQEAEEHQAALFG